MKKKNGFVKETWAIKDTYKYEDVALGARQSRGNRADKEWSTWEARRFPQKNCNLPFSKTVV